jgi:hypothetical protein
MIEDGQLLRRLRPGAVRIDHDAGRIAPALGGDPSRHRPPVRRGGWGAALTGIPCRREKAANFAARSSKMAGDWLGVAAPRLRGMLLSPDRHGSMGRECLRRLSGGRGMHLA